MVSGSTSGVGRGCGGMRWRGGGAVPEPVVWRDQAYNDLVLISAKAAVHAASSPRDEALLIT